MNKKILNLSIPYLKSKELEYVKECIKSGWVSSAGPLINKFESKISSITNSKYAVACMNGTSALHISLILAGVMKNHEVIVPTITFIAPINTVRYCDANPIFMDCDSNYNIDINKTIEFLSNNTYQKKGKCINKKTKKIISAIIIVHVWGNPANIKVLNKICNIKNIKLIEDASESFGSHFNENKKHTGTVGFCGCLSFNGNKIITTGGGGTILTQNKKIALKAKYLIEQAKNKSIWFQHDEIGYNYRMTNLQAALGIAQIENFKKILYKRKKIFQTYKTLFSNNKNFKLFNHSKKSNHWMNLCIIEKGKKIKLLNLINLFRKELIEVRPIWKPNHLQKKFKKYETYKIKFATYLFKKSICLPSSTDLRYNDIKRVMKILN